MAGEGERAMSTNWQLVIGVLIDVAILAVGLAALQRVVDRWDGEDER